MAGLRATAPPPEPTVLVVVAAHDLPAGARVTGADLESVEFRPGTEPDGLVEDPAGRVLASPLRRGEAVTDARLVGPALADGQPGDGRHAGADPGRRDGRRCCTSATGSTCWPRTRRAGPPGRSRTSALVLAVPAPAADAAADALPGRLVVLGLDTDEVPAVAGASVTHFLTVAYAR